MLKKNGPLARGEFENGRLQTFRIRKPRGDYEVIDAARKNYSHTAVNFFKKGPRNSLSTPYRTDAEI